MLVRSNLSFVVLFVVAGCGGSSASTTPAEPAQATAQPTSGGNSGNAEEMPLGEFLGAATREALPELCSDASLLRTCYPTVDADLCANAFAEAMLACGLAMEDSLPPIVDMSTAEPVATAVATCARIAYQDGLAEAGIYRTPDCTLAH